ncbi:dihydroneopterin aldolase [Vulcanibacillus modesticaldus]|uniref:7,8-dihydroneopterin aldolase n=1 Tax=Vulcanibacillus modesticaldus TaxID=337097 RepID=A0A1D2YX70_9BACI|nr:dihydroneopterin aldolase [Vulcanibacillus modesticaldus]OEG00319.1 dihydroneopterin aldolase [Vulcanibacillus modesticaldus]
MDKIIFEKMQFYAYHGVFEEENRLGQKFEVDLEMFLNLKKAGKSDCLEDTVNYAKVYELVKDLLMGKRRKLLESLAESIAEELLALFPLEEVMVRVRKLQPPIPGHLQSVSVEIRRSADDR